MNKLIKSIRKINDATTDELQSIDFLSDLLESLIIPRGGQIKNQNCTMWQDPKELSSFLLYLRKFDIKSYIEVGAYRGGTFSIVSAYLNRVNNNFRSLAIDIDKHFSLYSEIKKILPVDYKVCTTDAMKGKSFDLCFIDGDHSYQWCERDFNNIGKHSKLCAFHDIVNCPGSLSHWLNIRKKYTHKEFINVKNRYGIGVLHIKNDSIKIL